MHVCVLGCLCVCACVCARAHTHTHTHTGDAETERDTHLTMVFCLLLLFFSLSLSSLSLSLSLLSRSGGDEQTHQTVCINGLCREYTRALSGLTVENFFFLVQRQCANWTRQCLTQATHSAKSVLRSRSSALRLCREYTRALTFENFRFFFLPFVFFFWRQAPTGALHKSCTRTLL